MKRPVRVYIAIGFGRNGVSRSSPWIPRLGIPVQHESGDVHNPPTQGCRGPEGHRPPPPRRRWRPRSTSGVPTPTPRRTPPPLRPPRHGLSLSAPVENCALVPLEKCAVWLPLS